MHFPGDVTRVIHKLVGAQTEIGLPQPLVVRTKGDDWKRLLVFINGQFLHCAPEHDQYEIVNGALYLNGFNTVKEDDYITIVDPIDGMRWLYKGIDWFHLY